MKKQTLSDKRKESKGEKNHLMRVAKDKKDESMGEKKALKKMAPKVKKSVAKVKKTASKGTAKEAAAGRKYNESPKHKKAEKEGAVKALRREKHTKF